MFTYVVRFYLLDCKWLILSNYIHVSPTIRLSILVISGAYVVVMCATDIGWTMTTKWLSSLHGRYTIVLGYWTTSLMNLIHLSEKPLHSSWRDRRYSICVYKYQRVDGCIVPTWVCCRLLHCSNICLLSIVSLFQHMSAVANTYQERINLRDVISLHYNAWHPSDSCWYTDYPSTIMYLCIYLLIFISSNSCVCIHLRHHDNKHSVPELCTKTWVNSRAKTYKYTCVNILTHWHSTTSS